MVNVSRKAEPWTAVAALTVPALVMVKAPVVAKAASVLMPIEAAVTTPVLRIVLLTSPMSIPASNALMTPLLTMCDPPAGWFAVPDTEIPNRPEIAPLLVARIESRPRIPVMDDAMVPALIIRPPSKLSLTPWTEVMRPSGPT